MTWTERDIPPQSGRVAVVTGATAGLGLETARALAGAGAEVILAGRREAAGAQAVRAIQERYPLASVRFAPLDLASLASVAAFSAALAGRHAAIDLLVNNAGVMALPARLVTEDGFEMQFGTNYLGHFALTAHLLPLLRAGHQPRVVSLSSIAHRRARIAFDDLQSARSYAPMAAYGQSKLAMLLFADELQRRSQAGGWGLASIAAHPGVATTELFSTGPAIAGRSSVFWRLGRLALPLLGQSASAGARPTLFAATAPDAKGGDYYGPDGFGELKGAPAPARRAPVGQDAAAAARLWDVSEQLTGLRFG